MSLARSSFSRWRFPFCVWSPFEQIVPLMQPSSNRGCKGFVANEVPLRIFKFILPLSKPTPLSFLPIANLSKLHCKTSAVVELKLKFQAFESSTEKWGFYSWIARGLLAEHEKDQTYWQLLMPRPPSMIPHWALKMATMVIGGEIVRNCSLRFKIIFKWKENRFWGQ